MIPKSVYLIPCICGVTVESHEPRTRHYCEDLTTTIPGVSIDALYCNWPRAYRELVIDGWGKI